MNHYALPSAYLTAGHYYTITYWLHRSFLDFGEIDLPSPARIVGAYLSVFITGIGAGWVGRPNLIVEAGLQSDPVVVNDWYAQNPITVILGQMSRDDMTPGQYNDIPLTQDGIDYLLTPGKKKFCLLGQWDFDDVAPWPFVNTYAHFNYHSDQKGPGYRPILKIEYYPA